MIKVVIVEDKSPILWSIKQKVQHYSTDLTIVGEAYNGQDALSQIRELKPDIVFTDIRMPVMNGLELISQAKKINKDIHFVIISGYNEFDYAREAMKLGVSDYILKPVTQEAIDDILNKITSQIKAKTLQDEKNLLQDLLNRRRNDTVIPPHFDCNYFIAAIICAGSYSSQTMDYSNPFNFFESGVNCDEIISRHLPRDVFCWFFAGKGLNEVILLLGMTESCNLDLHSILDLIGKEFQSLGICVTIAISKRINDINNIGMEVQNTRISLRKNLVFGRPGIIHNGISSVNSIDIHSFLDSSLERKMISFIQGNQRTLFFNELRKIIDHFQQNHFTQYNIENALKYMVHIFSQAVLEKSDIPGSMELEIEEVLCISKDYEALQHGLKSIFEQFFPNTFSLKQKREPLKEIIDTVENYIKTNFANQITINDIAEMVKVDPCHLSKTFKSMKGISPMEYLTNLRIEKSKELIVNSSNLMLKDIAEIVGYRNQYYFSRIFKAVTGQSPSEYKNSNSHIGASDHSLSEYFVQS